MGAHKAAISHMERGSRGLTVEARDWLRDQGAAYAERLAAEGIETEYHCVLGTIHGFLRLGRWIPTAGDALASVGHFLNRHLRAAPADG